MFEVKRRDVLIGGVGVAAATLAAATPAAAGDPSFMNNVPDGLLSGDELPTFKFALEKSAGKVVGESMTDARQRKLVEEFLASTPVADEKN